MMVMGAVMLGGIITGKPPVTLTQCTPLARLTSEYNVFVLPANSPLKTMADVVAQLKKDPGSVKWGGGSRGSTEHIAAAMIAREVGVDPAKINYVAFRGGGEATAAILGGNVTVGGSGYSEFAEYITSGKMRAIGGHLGHPPEGHRRAHAEGAGHQRRDRQLARRVWRPRHHAAQRKELIDHDHQGHQEQGLDRGAGQEQLDARRADRRRLRRISWTATLPACAPRWSSPA
jgi:putative tricarboxylic transport membrane protein